MPDSTSRPPSTPCHPKDGRAPEFTPAQGGSDGRPWVDHSPGAGTAVIELRVRNHPGAMSHITGLFARRAFNLEAIFCAPREDDDGATSRMLLLVASEPRLEQVERQLLRLHDVVEVRQRTDLDRAFFARFVDAVPPREVAAVPL